MKHRYAVLLGRGRQRRYGEVECDGCERPLRVHKHGRRARRRLQHWLRVTVNPAGPQRFAVALQTEEAMRVAATSLGCRHRLSD